MRQRTKIATGLATFGKNGGAQNAAAQNFTLS
jgi:hypothetical protein